MRVLPLLERFQYKPLASVEGLSSLGEHDDDGTGSYLGKEGYKSKDVRKPSRTVIFLTVLNASMFLVSTAWFMIWLLSNFKMNADLRRVSSYSPSSPIA